MPAPNVTLQSVDDRVIAGPGAISRSESASRSAAPSQEAAFFHSGGWCVGDLDSEDGIARAIAAESGAIVVSVDYRLAPENPFPAANEDSCAATPFDRVLMRV